MWPNTSPPAPARNPRKLNRQDLTLILKVTEEFCAQLRNLMTIVLLNSHALKDVSEDRRDKVAEIESAANRAVTLMTELLDSVRHRRKGNREPAHKNL
jgi:hypothetical protein